MQVTNDLEYVMSRHVRDVVVWKVACGVQSRNDGTTGHPVSGTDHVDPRPVVAEGRTGRLHARDERGLSFASCYRETPRAAWCRDGDGHLGLPSHAGFPRRQRAFLVRAGKRGTA